MHATSTITKTSFSNGPIWLTNLFLLMGMYILIKKPKVEWYVYLVTNEFD
jgi:hypothetical protein